MHRTRFWPEYDDEQVEAVAAVLRSGKVNAWTGPDVAAFEREFADHVGTAHAIAMANGTVTLDAALRALDLQPGDEVIVTPRSFVASASQGSASQPFTKFINFAWSPFVLRNFCAT